MCGNRIRILEQAVNLDNICVCMFSGRVYVNHRQRGKAESNEINVCVWGGGGNLSKGCLNVLS